LPKLGVSLLALLVALVTPINGQVLANGFVVSIGGVNFLPGGKFYRTGWLETRFAKQIVLNLDSIYRFYRPTESGKAMTPQRFFEYKANETNGFNPTMDATAKLFSPDEATQRLLIQSVRKLQSLEITGRVADLGVAVDSKRYFFGYASPFDKQAQEAKKSVELFLAQVARGVEEPSEADLQQAASRLDGIRNSPGEFSDKRKRFIDQVRMLGFPVDWLDSLDLLGGTWLESR